MFLELQPWEKSLTRLSVQAALIRSDSNLSLEWVIQDPQTELRYPHFRSPGRQSQLWEQSLCLEAFLSPEESAMYWEVNATFGGAWNLYRFYSYRKGMIAAQIPEPVIEESRGKEASLRFTMKDPCPGKVIAYGLAAITQTASCRLHWALAHHSDRPDFHHRGSFLGRCRQPPFRA